MRKLPVYILIDCSESMAGEPIRAVQDGLQMMMQALKKNPHALETVWMSVLTFDARAKVAVPMCELADFQPPSLSIKPGTALGAAMLLLKERIKRDVQKTTANEKGDWRPIVFLMTDGQPTDAWEKAADELKKCCPKIANIYAIGCGREVDYSVLNAVSDVAFHLKESSSDLISKFFIWMTASVQSMSQGADSPLSLDKTPAGISGDLEIIDPTQPFDRYEYPLQIFLHSRCVSTGKMYMLRYILNEQYRVYEAKLAHELPEDFFAEGTYEAPAVPSDLLYGSIPCPFCGNPSWAQCGTCKSLMCAPNTMPDEVQCPSCKTVLHGGSNGEFNVSRSSG